MRPSKRTTILEATLRVIERDGVAAVTYESVAAEAGLTKAGLVYHFPTREALLHAVESHLAGQWETAMTAAAGAPADALTEAARLAAYAAVTSQNATRAELLLLLETAKEHRVAEPFAQVLSRWTPAMPSAPPLTTEQLQQFVAQLAADGLWLHDAINGSPLPPEMRGYLAAHLAELALPRTPRPGSEDHRADFTAGT